MEQIPEGVEEVQGPSAGKQAILKDLQKFLKIKAGLQSNNKAFSEGQDVQILKKEIEKKINEAQLKLIQSSASESETKTEKKVAMEVDGKRVKIVQSAAGYDKTDGQKNNA